jgi:hypothetical protein
MDSSLPSMSSSTAAAVVTVTQEEDHQQDDADDHGLRLLQPVVEPRLRDLLHAVSDAIYQFLPTYNPKAAIPMKGIRYIQTNRIEMFVVSPDKSCAAFDQLCRNLLTQSPRPTQLHECYDTVDAIRTAIVSYAKNATLLEDRLLMMMPSSSRRGGDNPVVHYGTFSLIISNGIVPDQLPHVDVQPPDFQFGMIVTDNSPATRVYQSLRSVVRTPDDLAAFLGVGVGRVGVEKVVRGDDDDDDDDDNDAPAAASSPPSKIAAVLAQFPASVELLQSFGLCLSTLNTNDYTLATAWDHLPAGTVLSLPGGQLHAGPACRDFRVVLFWTAHGSAHSVYHPDIQYFDGLLLAELMLPIWRFITVEDRYRFLKLLYPVTQRYKGLWGHFPNNIHFHNFVHELTISKQPVAFMREIAASPNLAPIPICYPTIDGESLVCVSATKLATAAMDGDDDGDGEEAQPIAVYRRPNGDVCIQVRLYYSIYVSHSPPTLCIVFSL